MYYGTIAFGGVAAHAPRLLPIRLDTPIAYTSEKNTIIYPLLKLTPTWDYPLRDHFRTASSAMGSTTTACAVEPRHDGEDTSVLSARQSWASLVATDGKRRRPSLWRTATMSNARRRHAIRNQFGDLVILCLHPFETLLPFGLPATSAWTRCRSPRS